MYKKLTCLMTFVLVLSIAGVVQAGEFYDDFNTPHNYITEGLGNWDGMVGLGPGETVDELNASIDSAGKLYIESHGARWEPDWEPLGPFLYKLVDGDFTATVKVEESLDIAWNDIGLMARVPQLELAGPGEDFECVDHFLHIGANMGRSVDNGSESEWGFVFVKPYLRLSRVGNMFYHEVSSDGADWELLDGSPKEREDMNGLVLQVGLQQATYTNNSGYVAFDDFTLSYSTPSPYSRSPNPANGVEDVSTEITVTWGPGYGAESHDVYFGDSFNEVNDANNSLPVGSSVYKGNQPLEDCSYSPGPLQESKTYCWRIDEIIGATVYKGDVWSFKTTRFGDVRLINSFFDIMFDGPGGGIKDIKRVNDEFDTDFVLSEQDYITSGVPNPGWLLGDVIMKYRIGGGSWWSAKTAESNDNKVISVDKIEDPREITITYPTDSNNPEGIRDFDVVQRWVLDGNSLTLDVNITNTTGSNLELGDVGIPLPFYTAYGGSGTIEVQTKRVMKHGFFSGHGSYSYWTRVNGIAPYLVMTTPSEDTRFEFYYPYNRGNTYEGNFVAYVYSGLEGPSFSGTWRQQHTTRTLSQGEQMNLRLHFRWADNLQEVRNMYYEDNEIDIEVVPGMSLPQDLHALIKLRTKATIDSITAEYPADTTITYVGEPEPDTHVYKVEFSQLGENMLTINHNGTEQTHLEFFSTEPLETLIKKRTSHLINYQQVRNPSKWYDGLVGPWDMRYGVVRTPDNTDGFDGWWGYVIACDDPGLCHVPLVASKNVHYPLQSEIEAVEYYIENFVWGGLQRMDTESPNPWGIYGVPNWYEHRVLDPDPWATGRIFDYPHIVNLYYCMYEIAKKHPDMVSYLDKDGYLYRAYHTAMKYFDITSWVYEVGTMDELVILEVIDALRDEGLNAEADALESHWEKKVKYFIYDHPYPYGSEFAVDTTAFESTHALAKWAMENPLVPDPEHPDVNQQDVENFLHRQMVANIAVRGWLEPAFYTLGSDYRALGNTWYNLSYMAQMGGWAVLDYALNFAEEPISYLSLGYASYLSSWALMNTGTGDPNYGYWHPGDANDGASGWAFEPLKTGEIWLMQYTAEGWINRELDRGVWYYDGEIDLGYGGALRMAKAVVSDGPIFGLFGYGCDVTLSGGKYYVEPKDGLRERLIMQNLGLQLKLDRDAFAKGQEIAIGSASHSISFVLENERLNAHTTKLTVNGLAAGNYAVKINSVKQYTFTVTGSEEVVLSLDIGSDATYDVSISFSADINSSGSVDFVDFAKFAGHWRDTNCGTCGGADLTGDGNVDWDDLKEFAASWLQ